jgi:hypothetical protein
MVRALLRDVFGTEWESSPGEKVVRIDWQLGAKGWTGREIVIIAGNDPDKNCLYHQVVGDAITCRYRFHAIFPPPALASRRVSMCPIWNGGSTLGSRKGTILRWRSSHHIEDRKAHWQSVYASRRPIDASNGTDIASRKAEQPGVLETPVPTESRKAKKPVRRNQKYKVIDHALQEIAESRPSTQEAVFQALDGRHVVIPPAEPFMAARGWIAGFRRDAAAARAWL